jgi:hypothetical protein
MRRKSAGDWRRKLSGCLALQLLANRQIAELLALGAIEHGRREPRANRRSKPTMFHVKHCSVGFFERANVFDFRVPGPFLPQVTA